MCETRFKLLALSMLLFATVGYGQQDSFLPGIYNPPFAHEQPKPLKCGKYEHDTSSLDDCHSDPNHIAICTHTPVCAPDMHPLTEQEWQELVEDHARLRRALEHLTKTMPILVRGSVLSDWRSDEH